MKIVYRRGLPALCAAVLAAGVIGVGTPAFAAGQPPFGSYTASTDAVWSGQQVTVTQQTLGDEDTPVEEISRTVTWGDGATTTAAVDETSWTHTYTTPGTYRIEVILNDGEISEVAGGATKFVKVTTPPGTLGWQKSTVYTSYVSQVSTETWSVEANFTPKGLPTEAGTHTWTEWEDKEVSLLKKQSSSTTVPHYFDAGTYAPEVYFENKNGKTTPRKASPLKVAIDSTPPSVSFTFPSSPGKGSSWKALKGTVKDSQSGPDIAAIVAIKYTATTDYYYNFDTKKWVKITNPAAQLPDGAFGVSSVSSAGAWSVPISGVTKGYHLYLQYWAYDKVGNETDIFEKSAYISS